jgi:hypothetical protein
MKPEPVPGLETAHLHAAPFSVILTIEIMNATFY